MNKEEKLHEYKFQARMNIFYHEERERYYTNFVNLTTFITVISSSMAFAVLGDVIPFIGANNKILAAFIAFVVATLNGAVLAVGMYNKIILHSTLKNKWIDFYKISDSDFVEIKDFKTLEDLFSSINTSEPAPDMKKLDKAYHMACRALGLKPETKLM